MSVSEIIKKRFGKNIIVNKVKDPKDVAKFIIKEPDMANSQQDFDGSIGE